MRQIGDASDIEVKRGCMTNCRVTEDYIHWNQYSIKASGVRRTEISEITRVFGFGPDKLLNAIIDEGIAALYGMALYDREMSKQEAGQ